MHPHRLRRLALAAAFALTAAAPAAKPSAPPLPSTLHVDAAYVTKTGSGPQALIMIPGLLSGAFVWDALVPELAERYTVYSLTFAGFDGEPPVTPPYLDAFDKSVVDLIAQEQLRKPILVGHGMGGHLALRLAEELGDRLGGAVVVDGLPVFPPAYRGEKEAARIASAASFRDTTVSEPQAAYEDGLKRLFGSLASDPKTVEMLWQRALRSDRGTYAGAAYEYLLADLRPGFGRIAVPVEFVVPADNEAAATAAADAYEVLCAGVAQLDVEAIAPSMHFIMYDRPDQLRAELDRYLLTTVGS